MVEAHAQAVEDYLIEGLPYNLSPGASYVSARRSISFFEVAQTPTLQAVV